MYDSSSSPTLINLTFSNNFFLSCTLLLLLLLASRFFAQAEASSGTNVSGTIDGETWSAANSPYNVTGDIDVVSLTIEPGVTVSLQGDYVFEVSGSLSAVGTEGNQILFTRSTPGWKGIYFDNSPDQSTLAYVQIENATNSGMRMVGSQVSLSHCTFSNNSASYGGALNANGVDSLTITDCLFSNNSATQGGAIYVTGASSDLLIEKSHFTNNTALGGHNAGGGAILLANGTTEIKGSTFANNSISGSSTQYGGGLAVYGGTAEIINSTFSDNFSEEYGGGIYVSNGATLLLAGSIVAQNDANTQGDGLYSNGTLILKNTSIVANEGEGLRRAGGTTTLQNSIVYFNTGAEIVGSATVTYSDIEGGFAGTGNIDASPLFLDVANGDLHFSVDSPAIDVADNSALPPDTLDLDGDGNTTEPIPYDLDGHPRVINGVVDMGAYEYISSFEPNINVAPASLSVTVAEGESSSESFTISNNGTAALDFNIIVSDTTWLNTSPISGTVAPSQSTAVTVNLDASSLSIGVYTNSLTIESNDPDQTQVVVELILTVGNEALTSDIRLTNVRDVSFTVSWLTDIESTGLVRYGTDPNNLNQYAYDERGIATFDDTHYVIVSGLQPITTYYFDVVSGSVTDNNSGTHYSVTTAPTIGLPNSDLIFGQVFKSDGTTVASGSMVYITLEDSDGAGSTNQAAPLSVLVDSNGYWSTDLGNARSADLSDYFSYSNSGDLLLLEALGASDDVGCQRIDTGADTPAADIVLSLSRCAITWSMTMQSGWNHISLPLAPLSPIKAEDSCQEINTQGGDPVEIDRWYNGGWDGHVCELSFNNFDMVLGSDYFIKSNMASNWTIEGYQVTEAVSLTLQIGWNSIGIPHTDAYTANSLCDDIIDQAVSLQEVTRWHNGGWPYLWLPLQ
jgi:predicted outer membrane repeat protein